MDYKEAFFKLLDEKIEDLPLQKGEDREETVNKVFELLESLEDQEAAKDWVAQSIDMFAGEDDPFIAKAIRFLRIQAFKKAETPTEGSETEEKDRGETSGH